MNKNNIADKLTARSLAGYATELTVWNFIYDIASQIDKADKTYGQISLDNISIQETKFVLNENTASGFTHSTLIWQLGTCAYELITGSLPFGGKGKEGQTTMSPLPSFSEARASKAMSTLVKRCLAFKEEDRIKFVELVALAEKGRAEAKKYASDMENLKYKKPQNRCIRMKTYDFWPEAMAVIAFLIMLAMPQTALAQYNQEMEKLIKLTTMMRNQQNRSKVLTELKNDDKWTLMDELARDLNECTYGDKVSMFGVNDIAAEIAQREKGIVNTGGRFRNSTNTNYHYSFIELTAKAGKKIVFRVNGHKGTQQVAVVPFDQRKPYTAIFYTDSKEQQAHTVKDGISYFTVGVGKRGNYEFEISNKDPKNNASFVVITYNPWK